MKTFKMHIKFGSKFHQPGVSKKVASLPPMDDVVKKELIEALRAIKMTTTHNRGNEQLLIDRGNETLRTMLKPKPTHQHIDEWLDSSGSEFYSKVDPNNDVVYAKFVIDYMRFPAFKISGYQRFMNQFKLFCTFEGVRYRVGFASRLGMIGLRKDFDAECSADCHAYPDQCSNWSDKP